MSSPKCPGCQQSDFSKLDGQKAVCRPCSKAKRCVFQFCWACQREWPCNASANNSCMLPNCALRAALLSVKEISDPQSLVNGCPYFRACPGCQALVTHSGEGCPYIICPNCEEEFCFRCLRPQCYEAGYDDEYDDDDDGDDDNDDDDDLEIGPCVIADNAEIINRMGL
ncbi:E3 ubiquitin-protein ligase RNF144A-like [Carassius carassius]|uniref:E3 ubiquitin-protein ligase RNF144A-like n=1 Tax=Carassius carassius TaxID=217509 RepID=UPI0028693C2B|nr:E3 ubiquitin-protein ligase RNF144A-like [Carassius carassius]